MFHQSHRPSNINSPLAGMVVIYVPTNTVIFCSNDFLRITDKHNYNFGKYCGVKTGQAVLVTGDYAKLMFHSNLAYQRRGFYLYFTAIPHRK